MSQLGIVLTALERLNISAYVEDEAITIKDDISVTANMFDVFAWQKLAKKDDQQDCQEFVADSDMTIIPAGSVIYVSPNASLECISIRVKGSPNVFYIPISDTAQTMIDAE
jgi:hypothetical protein